MGPSCRPVLSLGLPRLVWLKITVDRQSPCHLRPSPRSASSKHTDNCPHHVSIHTHEQIPHRSNLSLTLATTLSSSNSSFREFSADTFRIGFGVQGESVLTVFRSLLTAWVLSRFHCLGFHLRFQVHHPGCNQLVGQYDFLEPFSDRCKSVPLL